jgi:mono/diheme cytochrome c family protein
VVQAILHGIPWREGRAAPYMPAFADTLTDAQIGALTTYVRRRWGGKDEDVSADTVRKARAEEGS